jgi:hypothetical protein
MPSIPARRDPVSDRSTGERRVRRGDGEGVGGVDFGGKCVEQAVFVGKNVGLAVEDRCKIATGEFVEERHSFVAHPVPEMGRIGVGWIVDRVESELVTQRLGFGSPQRQDRMAGSIPMRRQPGPRCAAQQVQQHRLGAIVKCVPGGDDGRQNTVASRTSSASSAEPSRNPWST